MFTGRYLYLSSPPPKKKKKKKKKLGKPVIVQVDPGLHMI